MYMVRLYRKLKDFPFVYLACKLNHAFDTFFNLTFQYSLAVLGDKDKVVSQVISCLSSRLQPFIHGHIRLKSTALLLFVKCYALQPRAQQPSDSCGSIIIYKDHDMVRFPDTLLIQISLVLYPLSLTHLCIPRLKTFSKNMQMCLSNLHYGRAKEQGLVM